MMESDILKRLIKILADHNSRIKLTKILADHKLWIVSQGKRGKLANLEGWNLDGINLESADLPYAKLKSASLRNAYLPNANFSYANLLKVNFQAANLRGADFKNANLSFSDMSNADLEKANFEGASLRGANFKNANLSFSILSDADLKEANFEGANLEGTEILNIHLNSTKFQDAGLSNNNLEMPPSKEGPNTNARGKSLPMDTNIVSDDSVKNAVHELFEKLNSDIRIDQIKTICKYQNGRESIVKIDFEHGEIVTHNDQVAFKLNFNISYKWNLLIDLMGNYIIS